MQLLFNNFYKLYGIRRVQQLLSPRLFPMEVFSFPRNASYHFVSHDDSTTMPDPSQHFYTNYTKRIMMDIVTDMTEHRGSAKRVATQIQMMVRPWFVKNRLFKYLKEPTKNIKDPLTLTVFDYACLQKLYRYTNQPLTPYYKWFNIEKTLWDNILQETIESERQNFIFMELPDVLPSYSSLKMYTERLSTAMLKVFDSPSKHFLLELWRWIGEEARSTSLLANFKQENLDKVNIVFIFKDKWCTLNLGQFNKWREHPEETEEVVEKPVGVTYRPMQLQKLFLKFFISIQSQQPVEEVENEAKKDEADSPVVSGDPQDDKHDAIELDDPDDDDDNEETPLALPKTPVDEVVPVQPVEATDDHADSYSNEIDDDVFKDIDKDLEALEYIENKSMMLKGVSKNQETIDTPLVKAPVQFIATPEELEDINTRIFNDSEPDEALTKFIDKHAEYGLMTAADYRATLKQAAQFMAKPSPYRADQSTRDYVKISQEDLKIQPSEIKLPDISTVPDKSMLESSLLAFDSKYIKELMPKDITSMVANVQKSGIIIQDYAIETENSALGEYEMHTLKIKPIDGVVSTLHFKVPKVDLEGNFIANGNKYHMRKQRAD